MNVFHITGYKSPMHFGLKNTASGTKYKQIHPVRVELKAAEGPRNKKVFGLSTSVSAVKTHSLKISKTRSSWKVSTNIPTAKLALNNWGNASAGGHKGILKPPFPKVVCDVSSTLALCMLNSNISKHLNHRLTTLSPQLSFKSSATQQGLFLKSWSQI